MALTPGHRAPDFRLSRIGGGEAGLADFLARGPAWLVFVKSTCPTCHLAIPFAERAHRTLPEGSGSVVMITQDTEWDAEAVASRFGLTLPLLFETKPYDVSRAYQLENVPTFFLIDPGGSIRYLSSGFVRDDWETTAGELAAGQGGAAYQLFRDTDDAPAWRPG